MSESRKATREGDARSRCYDQLRSCMNTHIRTYYRAHPERLFDQRSIEKVQMMRDSLICIFEVLDGYDIKGKESGL